MILSLTLFVVTSAIIVFSTIGYGVLTLRFLKFEKLNLNYGLLGILGLFSLSVIASYTHLFLPHNYTHNIIIILIGLFFFSKIEDKDLKQLKLLSTVFIFLFISILISKTNEDFGYYHLPNSIQFAQQKLQFGLGNLNHGFKHISSIFQLMSLHYLPFFKYNLFNLTNFLFLFFFLIFALKQKTNHTSLSSNISKILLCFFIILFVAKFSRIAEYGSDISAQIIIAIFLFYLIEIIFNNKLSEKYLSYYLNLLLILITFSISLKFIFIIYSILFFFVFYIFIQKKIFLKIINFKTLFLPTISISIFILLNFTSTGCLIYPIEKLCFSKTFEWALDYETIKYLNFHYELWAKAGKGPNFSVEDPSSYLISLNWVNNWYTKYFVGKFSDFLLVSFLILLIFSLVFFKNFHNFQFKFKKYNLSYFIFYFGLLTILVVWFLNFPTLRYAGFIIVFTVIIFPFIVIVDKAIDLSLKINLRKLSIIFLISYSIFLVKNIQRINNELKLSIEDHHNFKNFPFYWIKNVNSKEIDIGGHKVYLVEGVCWNTKSTCVRSVNNLNIMKKNNYIFYSKKK